eukprot:TRINITY_DN605_c0_g2_i1.p1 TRINITY_DN605_c0_g2~~TRINITY_DN605_c0_g2_i1.p1  ORF type:complete len:254 (+),score=26.01 TRINITY_DN605_c0_g2_i1:43-804(+)
MGEEVKAHEMKVIGAGFGRTGTSSLQAALDLLGLRCYHMTENSKNQDNHLWLEAWDCKRQKKDFDWNRVFGREDNKYLASVDWPSCDFYLEQLKQYPNAKVILTVRDPERWYASCCQTIFCGLKFHKMLLSRIMHIINSDLRNFSKLYHIFMGDNFDLKLNDKELCIKRFKQNIEQVKAAVDEKQLLVFEVKQGWEPLCKFLGIEIPDQPFPHVNSTEEFRKKFRTFNLVNNILFYGLITILILIIAVVWMRF